jgi:hypothetical protein
VRENGMLATHASDQRTSLDRDLDLNVYIFHFRSQEAPSSTPRTKPQTPLAREIIRY